MLPYIILLLTIMVTLMILKVVGEEKLLFLPFLILTLYSGFRSGIGIDTENYNNIFHYIINGKTSFYNIDFGYELLVRAVHFIGGTPQLVLILFSLATNYFIYKFILNNSSNYYLSTVIYVCLGPFFLGSMNTMRQALAIAVFAYSLKFISENKPFKYIINISIFSFFHSSLLLMLPFFWILKKRINYMLLFSTIPLVVVLFRIGIFDFLIKGLGYGKLLSMDLKVFNIQYLLFLIIVTIIILLTSNTKKNSKSLQINLKLAFFSAYTIIIGMLVNSAASVIFTRMNLYFFISTIVLIPFALKRFKEKNVILSTAIIILVFLYFNTILTSRTMLPYEFNFMLFD